MAVYIAARRTRLTRSALCAIVFAALPLALCVPSATALSIFGHKKPANASTDQKPADPNAPAATTGPAPGTPQLNEDGSPKLDANGDPVLTPPPACVSSKGHKCPKKKKEKTPRVEPVTISRGIFTVDGVIGKAALNYDIPDLKFIYFYAPGIGVAVISDNKFSGAVEQKGAFKEHSLTIKVNGDKESGDHVMELYSDDILLSKRGTAGKVSKENKKSESAFVAFNAGFTLPVKYPIIGYGKKSTAPYEWPGSKLNVTTKGIDADAPAVPKQFLPKLAANPCPTGQVLLDGSKIVPIAPQTAASNAAAIAPTAAQPFVLTGKLHCVLTKDVPAQPKAPEKYVPLDQRPRS